MGIEITIRVKYCELEASAVEKVNTPELSIDTSEVRTIIEVGSIVNYIEGRVAFYDQTRPEDTLKIKIFGGEFIPRSRRQEIRRIFSSTKIIIRSVSTDTG